MISKPVRECHHGEWLWVNKSLDALRHYECLCDECARFRPAAGQVCEAAAGLSNFCAEHHLETIVTWCPRWERPAEVGSLRHA